jgi:hypothetical protein
MRARGAAAACSGSLAGVHIHLQHPDREINKHITARLSVREMQHVKGLLVPSRCFGGWEGRYSEVTHRPVAAVIG